MQALQTATNIAFKNILFLTDFSEASQAALAYAMGLSRHFKAHLFPAHASDPVVLTETVNPDIVDEIIEHSQNRLSSLIKDKDIEVTPLFERGSVETLFPHWIDENGIDLVIVGTHGRRGMERFLLGSSAEFIFRNSPCPVLTAGPHVTLRPYHGFAAEHILFPTDLGPHAEHALTYALSFARENHARLTLIHLIKPQDAFRTDSKTLLEETRNKVETMLPDDVKEWCTPEIIVEVGDAALGVLEFADKERPDLIVLGLPKNKNFNSHFRTGVTFKIISQSPCPVLTIRDLQE